MPITINVGSSKKVGTANYGSLGATCNVSFEAGHDLLESDPAAFQEKVQDAFLACRQAVQEEIACQQNGGSRNPEDNAAVDRAAESAHANGNGTNGNGSSANGSNGHSPTERQMTYARQLASQIKGLGVRRLETLAQRLFGRPLAALTGLDVSVLIDTLKDIKSDLVDLAAILEDDAP